MHVAKAINHMTSNLIFDQGRNKSNIQDLYHPL
jgi:hypothetical protein